MAGAAILLAIVGMLYLTMLVLRGNPPMRFSRTFRLIASDVSVDVRPAHFEGAGWLSADTPDGPSLWLGRTA